MSRLATPRFGIDAAGPVPIEALKDVKASFVIRYLSRYDWKVLTASEYRGYRGAGIDVGLVFEDSATRPSDGYVAGKNDAQVCRLLGSKIGLPDRFPCFWAYDHATGGNASRFEPYAEGFAEVMGGRELSGPYGDFYICSYFGERGYLSWQCTAAYSWNDGTTYSNQKFYEKADCYQYSNSHYVGGAGVDYDHLFDERCLVGFHSQPPTPEEVETGMIAAVTNRDGRVELFVEKTDGSVWHTWQKEAGGGWEGAETGKRNAEWHALGTPGK